MQGYRTQYYLIMKITSKGQVTIPLPLGDRFGLKPGVEVEFVPENGKVATCPRRKCSDPVGNWLRHETGLAKRKTTAPRIMKLTRVDDCNVTTVRS